jgi:membrane protein DedA with SNARE-associated domain
MARSHHRKKHKEHLRQFKHKSDTVSSTARTKAAGVFTIVGAVIGSAVGYMVTHGALLWTLIGLMAGVTAGYLIGRNVDKGR